MKRLREFEEYNYDNPFWHIIRYLRDHRDQAKLIKIAFDRPQHDFPPEAYPTKEQLNDLRLLELVEQVALGYRLTEVGHKVASYLKQRQAQLNEVFNNLRTI
jgi:hypothetical protein